MIGKGVLFFNIRCGTLIQYSGSRSQRASIFYNWKDWHFKEKQREEDLGSLLKLHKGSKTDRSRFRAPARALPPDYVAPEKSSFRKGAVFLPIGDRSEQLSLADDFFLQKEERANLFASGHHYTAIAFQKYRRHFKKAFQLIRLSYRALWNDILSKATGWCQVCQLELRTSVSSAVLCVEAVPWGQNKNGRCISPWPSI